MKKWLQNFKRKLQVWMIGRYGYDELSKTLTIAALVCMVLSMFVALLYPVALICLFWSLFRIYSRNIAARRKEREVYLNYTGRVKRWLKRRKSMWAERSTHRYYKCPGCKMYLRVPKGRGKIEISCPKCHSKIIRKT